jgi:hypothetical protein
MNVSGHVVAVVVAAAGAAAIVVYFLSPHNSWRGCTS